jgi:hypothetical protein
MRFALLGADAESQDLAAAATAAGHALVWSDAGRDSTTASNTAWEELLDSEAADAVIVGAGGAAPDVRARQIQDLAKQGRPLLTVHPVVPSVISYFEIDMARTESGALVQHFNPLVSSVDALPWDAFVRDGHPTLGAAEQITATRQLADRSREAVLWHFARDVELLAHVAGRFDRIGAHAAMGDPEAAYASLSVQLLGARQIPVRWSVEPVAQVADLAVTIIFQRGRLIATFDGAGVLMDVREQEAEGETCSPRASKSPATHAVERFANALAARDSSASDWTAALDAMELADTIEISLRRGRMIDVHHRELSETLAFKGVMSALGCGVLTVVVPLLLFLGWITGLLGIPLAHYWPHVLLLLLAAFLGLQFLPKLVPPATHGAGSAGDAPRLPSRGLDDSDD